MRSIVHQPFDQIHRLGLVQLGERDETRAGPRRGPRRTDVEEVGTRETEEQDRRPAREAEDILEQVEHRRICPVDVVHHHDESRVAASVSKSRRNACRLLR